MVLPSFFLCVLVSILDFLPQTPGNSWALTRVAGSLCPASVRVLGELWHCHPSLFISGGSVSLEEGQHRGEGDLRKSEEGLSDHLKLGVQEAVRNALE